MGSLIKELLRLPLDVCFGSKADICGATRHVRFVPIADMLNKLSGKYSERKSAFLRFFRVWGPMECT